MKFKHIILSAVLAVSSLAQAEGTRGGGNSVGSQIVDNYLVDLNQIEGYNEITRPILEKLKSEFPNMAYTINVSLRNLTWYMMPAPIKPVDFGDTGIAAQTTQVASQNHLENEVFIDQKAFAVLDLKNKGALLLHEVLLNIRCGYECSRSYYKDVRKMVNTFINSSSIEAWKSTIAEGFMTYNDTAHLLGGTGEFILHKDEIAIYKPVLEKWRTNLSKVCNGLPPAGAPNESSFLNLMIALDNADYLFTHSEFCKNNRRICSALPSGKWRGFMYNQVTEFLQCP